MRKLALIVIPILLAACSETASLQAEQSDASERTEVQFDISVDTTELPNDFVMSEPSESEKSSNARAVEANLKQTYGLNGVTVDYHYLSDGKVWLTETVAYQDNLLMFANYVGTKGGRGYTISCNALAPVRKAEVSLKQCAERVKKELGSTHSDLIENPNG